MYNRYAQVKLKSGLSLSSSDSKALSPVATTVAGNGNYSRQCGRGLSRLEVDLESLLSQVESILLTSVTSRSMLVSIYSGQSSFCNSCQDRHGEMWTFKAKELHSPSSYCSYKFKFKTVKVYKTIKSCNLMLTLRMFPLEVRGKS